jgi:hypothetical protein
MEKINLKREKAVFDFEKEFEIKKLTQILRNSNVSAYFVSRLAVNVQSLNKAAEVTGIRLLEYNS